jgi:hypothetical protein
LKYAIIDLILTLGGEKAYVECQILFSWKESDLKRKYSFKLKARIVSHTKSNNSLTNALVKHEVEHMPNIFEMRGVT